MRRLSILPLLCVIIFTVITIIVLITSSSASTLVLSASPSSSSSATTTTIDDEYCCCSSNELATNALPLLSVLDELTTKPFFRYFRVNVKKKCPYWAVQMLCTQKGNPCKFCRCDAKEIPVGLRTESDMGNALNEDWGKEEQEHQQEDTQQAENTEAPEETTTTDDNAQKKDLPLSSSSSSSDITVSASGEENNNNHHQNSLDRKTETKASDVIGIFDEQKNDLEAAALVKKCKEEEEQKKKKIAASLSPSSSCTHQQQQQKNKAEIADPKSEYVDLVRNPEGNTFYLGEKASRVWRAIYEENCFNLIGNNSSETSTTNVGECREQLAFYRLISGLHTSISTHIAAYYHFHILPGDSRYKPTTSAEDEELHRLVKLTPEEKHMRRAYAKPNCDIFHERLTKKPHHVSNMHFLYRFVIRALTRSRSAFVNDETKTMQEHLKIGDAEADAATETLVVKLFDQHLLCSPTFNESKLLQDPQAVQMLPEMKRMIRNMTTILDCISCEKCRLWGKLQLLGLATAFKVVMNPADSVPVLERKELMSLVNLARQLTDSVHNNNVMCKKQPQCSRKRKDDNDSEGEKSRRNGDL